MGDAGGNMAHWAGLYGGGAPAAEATVVTAAAGTTVSSSSPTSGGSSGGSPSGGPRPRIGGGRAGKPARRRSRASRRAPVTLLNTDASNFRAMVQQFTGVPFGPVSSFGERGAPLPVRPSPAVAPFDHHHQLAASTSQHRTPLQGQLLFRPQPQQYGYGGGDMSFAHGFESSAAEEDRQLLLLLQSIQAAQMMPSRPASANNTSNGCYNFG